MRKNLKTGAIGFVLPSLLLFASAAAAPGHLYVDPVHGDDGWDGSVPYFQSDMVGPKRSIQGAQAVVRQWIADGLTGDVYVELGGGRYELAAPLVFTTADSHPVYTVTWRSYGGQPVSLSGGRKIPSNWVWDAEKGCYKVHLPDVAAGQWWFRDLYRDQQRMIRARWPNAPTDTLKMAWSSDRLPSDSNLLTLTSVNAEKTQMAFDAAPLQALDAAHKAEVVLFRLWTSLRTVIERSAGTMLHLREPMTGCLAIQPGEQYMRKGFLENSYTFIDQDHEWALDTEGWLYYRGPDPNGSVFWAPRLHTLILVEGTSASDRVRNLNFVGLTLEHANFDFPGSGLNWNPRQAGVPCSYVHIPAAVRFTFTRNCALRQCRIVRCGGVGVHLDTGSWADSVERCLIAEISNSGVILGNTAEEWVSPMRTAHARVENSLIRRCGAGDFGAVGIGQMFMHGAVIRHNEIYELPYTGVSLGWHWWSSTTNVNTQKCEVAYNHIHQVCQMMDDGAAIYTLDDLTGTQISHNLIRQVGWKGQTCSGIYADEGSKNYTLYGNVVDTVYDGWCQMLHYENFNGTIHNNIFIDGQRREIYAAFRAGFSGFFADFSRNLFIQNDRADSYLSYSGNWGNPALYRIDYNAYYHPANPVKTFSDFTWQQWKHMGNDLHSYYQQDPLFEDAAHTDNNYRLSEHSPLLAAPMNFQQVQVQQAGLRSATGAFAGGELAGSGTIAGALTDIRKSNNVYQTITEIESSTGAPGSRYSFLEHTWVFWLPAGSRHVFFVEAFGSPNNEGDHFVFAYSADNVHYVDMLTVTQTVDDDIPQEYELPSTLEGTLFVRVRDTDRTPGRRQKDTLSIDRMGVRSEHDGSVWPPLTGDMNTDGKADLWDVARLSSYWQNPCSMTALLQAAEQWLAHMSFDSPDP